MLTELSHRAITVRPDWVQELLFVTPHYDLTEEDRARIRALKLDLLRLLSDHYVRARYLTLAAEAAGVDDLAELVLARDPAAQ